ASKAVIFPILSLKVRTCEKLHENFDGQPNRFITEGQSISTSTMRITMVQQGLSPGGIFNYGTVPDYMSGPAIVMCYNQNGFSVPPQILALTFHTPCICLRFAYVHLDGTTTLRFYDQADNVLEKRVLDSALGGRHQWVEFKSTRSRPLVKMTVETGDHCYMDNFDMCVVGPA
ncbi:hypothetical protein, partial [Pseudomonas sp.]|uniref:hypothetical protein n=1 Tax=Pseudomonas sp. TaxID=306 RepID=UPI003D6E6DEF